MQICFYRVCYTDDMYVAFNYINNSFVLVYIYAEAFVLVYIYAEAVILGIHNSLLTLKVLNF